MRRLAAYISVMIAAMAEALRTVVRLVWRAGRWVAETVAAPRSHGPGASAADEALDALAAASAPAPTPAPPRAEPPHVCVASEWGDVALAYAAARAAGEPEPDMRALDDAALSWIRGLDDDSLGRLRMLTPRHAGEHMLGTWPVPGLPPCPSLRDYERSLLPRLPEPVVSAPEPETEEPAFGGPRLVYG
ncbi:hypothetical protein [Methylobacterium sp. yr668]|uniref:hypothetical protein n=1 Tax=Methylobacterium sp. yr668 TaxID=1761801 RepID=UPI0008F23A82|nr:hypothetical protein [Methylobacterium sp. yr668]SFT30422.1 hypothetical protein SAMN04487845_1754 [Methylobacterium sp. yr668]